MSAALQIDGLNKSFGGVMATRNLTLAVEPGKLHAIIGPNGAGKTTLISQLSGALRPDAGRIFFDGRDITGLAPYARARLGIARSFQITSLLMQMSVLDNTALAVQARQGHSFKFIKPARAVTSLRSEGLAALRTVGLEARAETITGVLSHGEKRQLEIAVALASGASFLLLDEPMAGMGVDESAKMVELLSGLKGEKTMLLVEHDMDAVFALADTISVLVYGEIVATGTPEEIRNNDAVRRAYLGEA